MTALWVAVAGGAGTLARYAVGIAGQRMLGERFPWGTLAVNLLGCFAIGAVMVLAEARQLDPRVRVALVGGFLGGFTTYSAFAYETLALAERRSVALAGLYVGVTVAGCFLACGAGLLLARRLT
ncbi:MAG TPA: fluoride efflux transporter CrcB [Kofleriaceae bacterium]|nr:fluoride efflux transporter CrcB [Kofleriaceae bacterium]